MATPQGAAPSPRPATLTPAIIILGADALLAARPATAGQLVNACYAAGYSAVIPSSWGDELVASGCLREIAARGQGSVVLCACPRVAERMRRIQSLLPQLLPLASPPVAAARYLRARAGQHGVHITYVGDCPGGADASIDRHATPGALLRSLAKRGIDIAAQPREVEERLLRDARRFYSLPGGAPAPNWLYVEKRGYTLIEPSGRDFLAEVAFRVSKRERRVVDLAPRLGCSCSGVVVGQPWTEARDKVAAVEPPRAVHEVLDHDVPVDLSAPLEPWTGSAVGGEPTVPISLEALAGLYDSEAKASTFRSVPPPPIPWRRTSGPKSTEPTTPTRAPDSVHRLSPPAVKAAVDAPPLETVPSAADSDTPTSDPDARNAASAGPSERRRPSREPATPVLRDWRSSGETDVDATDAGRSVASTGELEATSHELALSGADVQRSINSATIGRCVQSDRDRISRSSSPRVSCSPSVPRAPSVCCWPGARRFGTEDRSRQQPSLPQATATHRRPSWQETAARCLTRPHPSPTVRRWTRPARCRRRPSCRGCRLEWHPTGACRPRPKRCTQHPRWREILRPSSPPAPPRFRTRTKPPLSDRPVACLIPPPSTAPRLRPECACHPCLG